MMKLADHDDSAAHRMEPRLKHGKERFHQHISRFHVQPRSKTAGLSLARLLWIEHTILPTVFACFLASMFKRELTTSPTCKCGAEHQTADNAILDCFISKATIGMDGLEILDDDFKVCHSPTSPEIQFVKDWSQMKHGIGIPSLKW